MNLRPAKQGFTLVEMLLVVLVVLLLAAVSVTYFGGMLRGTQLNEGASRFTSMLRFARAEAANSGRRIQISFDPVSTNAAGPACYQPRIKCELEPINEPGVYRDLNEPLWMDGQSSLLAWVESVRPMDTDAPVVSTNDTLLAQADLAEVNSLSDTNDLLSLPAPAPITFYPDGSSDSAAFMLVSADAEDERRIQITLNGFTGTVSQEAFTGELPEEDLAAEESAEKTALDAP
jgi:prepilin-type N-terminal cleavage/methylation domain-containing protein